MGVYDCLDVLRTKLFHRLFHRYNTRMIGYRGRINDHDGTRIGSAESGSRECLCLSSPTPAMARAGPDLFITGAYPVSKSPAEAMFPTGGNLDQLLREVHSQELSAEQDAEGDDPETRVVVEPDHVCAGQQVPIRNCCYAGTVVYIWGREWWGMAVLVCMVCCMNCLPPRRIQRQLKRLVAPLCGVIDTKLIM
uniref:Uncharacterized protein n=1 Tax=Timema monikensis TaxID=170555 RepID=A0A7R9E8E4_9NEOP|nr:unnamed protein product [Timema monikensis]